jgi:hypothetical protein
MQIFTAMWQPSFPAQQPLHALLPPAIFKRVVLSALYVYAHELAGIFAQLL